MNSWKTFRYICIFLLFASIPRTVNTDFQVSVNYTEAIAESSGLKSGIGWKTQTTIIAVKQKVPWYSAINLCSSLNGAKLFLHGPYHMRKLASYLSANGTITYPYMWTGFIKSGRDGQIYHGHDCYKYKENLDDIRALPSKAGITECVLLIISNLSNPFMYDDCTKKHYYLCLLADWSKLVHHYSNVSVSVDAPEILVKFGPERTNCFESCNWAFDCIGSTYNGTQGSCWRYIVPLTIDIYAKFNFNLTDTTDNVTFYYKPWKFYFVDIINYNSTYNLSNDMENFINECFPEVTTEVTTEFATSTCPCTLICDQSTMNDTILKEKVNEIKRILSLDKKQLSSTLRKLTSADDSRPSSKAIGIIGCLCLISITMCVILSDLPYAAAYFRKLASDQ